MTGIISIFIHASDFHFRTSTGSLEPTAAELLRDAIATAPRDAGLGGFVSRTRLRNIDFLRAQTAICGTRLAAGPHGGDGTACPIIREIARRRDSGLLGADARRPETMA